LQQHDTRAGRMRYFMAQGGEFSEIINKSDAPVP
jgi:hypothetical protein